MSSCVDFGSTPIVCTAATSPGSGIKICVNTENYGLNYYCYGSTAGCVWDQCSSNIDCRSFSSGSSSSSVRYTDPGVTCSNQVGKVGTGASYWAANTCFTTSPYPLCNSPCAACMGSATTCTSCIPGYTLTAGFCQPCPVGQYRSSAGIGSCVPCSSG